MESRHATLGRRTLEEIRQKRAAERLSKTSSGPDLTKASNTNEVFGIKKSESATRLSEVSICISVSHDITGLVSQLKVVQKNKAELDEENRALASKLQAKEVENNMMQKQLNDLVNAASNCYIYTFLSEEKDVEQQQHTQCIPTK
ncbi:hypothetical protein CQW23_31625 [Capsicum baccatum]|uniref:Uncharacterized protein n=1 Tax=Capsicum baccatum TaxID=33114 RepID=A0A2G2V713_CAPBA|nr:hypothetical protein CQW23_31625 [Capsicum baccatum]